MTNEISYYACRKEKGEEIIGAFSCNGPIETEEAPNGYAYIGQKHIDDTRVSIDSNFHWKNGDRVYYSNFFINKITKAEFDNIRAFDLAPVAHANSVSTGSGSYSSELYSAAGGYPELQAYCESIGVGKPVTLVGSGA